MKERKLVLKTYKNGKCISKKKIDFNDVTNLINQGLFAGHGLIAPRQFSLFRLGEIFGIHYKKSLKFFK